MSGGNGRGRRKCGTMVTVLRDGGSESKNGGGFGFKAAGDGASAVQRAAR